MPTSQKKIPKEDRGALIRIRVRPEEKALFQARANQFNDGNLSEYLRAAGHAHRKKKRGHQ